MKALSLMLLALLGHSFVGASVLNVSQIIQANGFPCENYWVLIRFLNLFSFGSHENHLNNNHRSKPQIIFFCPFKEFPTLVNRSFFSNMGYSILQALGF